MTVVICFWLSFSATLLLASVALWSGFRAQRRYHLLAGPVTIVGLTVTVVFAEQLVSARDFPRAELDFHLIFAKAGGLLALPVVISGVILARKPSWRKIHLVCVILFLLGVVGATATGIWVYGLSTPKS